MKTKQSRTNHEFPLYVSMQWYNNCVEMTT